MTPFEAWVWFPIRLH